MPRALLLRRALWSGVLLGLLFYLALTLWLALSGLFFPYQLDYGEGIVLWFTRELALGHPIYKGLEGLPYASSNYPPLAFALAAPLRALVGDSYAGGRALNIAATLLVTALIYFVVRKESREPGAKPDEHSTDPAEPGKDRRRPVLSVLTEPGNAGGLLAALFFLGSTFIYHWIPLFRVDLIGLAFSAAGIVCVWAWERGLKRDRHGRRSSLLLAAAAFLFLCAVYTKHSLVAAPAAAVLAVWLRDRRAAAAFALAVGASGGALFLALNQWTQGGFAFGLINSNATVWLWSTFVSLLRSFLWTYLILLALAAWMWLKRVRARQVGVLEVYMLAALALLVMAGRVGAWENYFFEAIFAVCIFAGLEFGSLFGRGAAQTAWLPLLLLIQLALFWPEHDPALARRLMDETRAGNAEVEPLVRAAQGTVISEDMGLLVTSGKPVEYYTFQYSSLARAGQWDQHWELENLRAGNFPLVVLSNGTREDVDHFRNLTREFVSALDYGYRLECEDARYHVYVPAPLEYLQSAAFGDQLALVGWSLSPGADLRPGVTLTLTAVWRAQKQPATRYKAFAHLEDASGRVVAQDDHEPKVGFAPGVEVYPTTRWAANEMVRDTYTLRMPEQAARGTYSLRVGWYDLETEDRLTTGDGNDFVELTRLEVR